MHIKRLKTYLESFFTVLRRQQAMDALEEWIKMLLFWYKRTVSSDATPYSQA